MAVHGHQNFSEVGYFSRTFPGDCGLFSEDITDTFTQLLSGWV